MEALVSKDKDNASQNQNDEEHNESEDGNSPEDNSYYRVNRLGREIFVGPKSHLILAIQSRRIRGDDLIFDDSSDTWNFARKHPIFLEATGQRSEEIERTRKKHGIWGRWFRFLVNAGLIGFLLYLLISYSENIEFKLGDGDSDFSDAPFRSSLNNKTVEQKMDSDGSGSGSGSGDGDGSDGEGYAEINALLEKEETDQIRKGDEIKQIFDLRAEGILENRFLFDEANTLSDMELLKQAQRVSSEMTQRENTNTKIGQAMYEQLQEAQAVASFVSQRNLALHQKEHRGANTISSQIQSQLHRVCLLIYNKRFCDLKKEHPDWKNTVVTSILKNEVLYAMNPEQVEAAWGRASRIVRERGGFKHCYGSGCEKSVWIFEKEVREIGNDLLANITKKSKKRKRKRKKR